MKPKELTQDQLALFTELATGGTVKTYSAKSETPYNTVINHKKSVLVQLGANTTYQAIAILVASGRVKL